MSYNLLWIFLLILQRFATSFPVPDQYDLGVIGIDQQPINHSTKMTQYEHPPDTSDEKVISVRITSSVAVGRGRGKPTQSYTDEAIDHDLKNVPVTISQSDALTPPIIKPIPIERIVDGATDIPPNLIGANIEYIKQLNAKKESKDHNIDLVHPFELMVKGQNENDSQTSIKVDEYEKDIQNIPLARKIPSTGDANRLQDLVAIQNPAEIYVKSHINFTTDTLFEPPMKLLLGINISEKTNTDNLTTSPTIDQKKDIRNINQLVHIDDSVAEPSIKSVEFAKYNQAFENIPTAATARSSHSAHDLTSTPQNERRNNPRLTTVSFNVVHDTKTSNDNEPSSSYTSSSQMNLNQKQFYDPKMYSQPAQVYSEPAKFYSEPAKIYSEPAKIYSEPAKVYSEPAKIYSEPSRFYSEPASLHLNQNLPSSVAPNYSPWRTQPQPLFRSTSTNTTPISTVTNGFQSKTAVEHQPEKNYEVDEKISVLTDGRSHGVQQDTSTEKCKQDNCKVGYVLEGRQFKKYRVEERTPDGFIVGEYGVVRNEDGALRGVRYTADGEASPRLIHDALMKFLQLT